jgi:integrase
MSKARRGHQEGGITARKNTHGEVISYLAQVRIPGGGRRSELLKTEQEARRWIRKTHADLASGRLTARRPPTLAEYLEKTWLPTIAGAVGSRTLASYTLNVKRLTPALGRVRLDELRPAHFQDFYHALTASGRAPRTVRQIHRTYHKALKDGLRLDLVARNPTEGVSLPRIPTPSHGGTRGKSWPNYLTRPRRIVFTLSGTCWARSASG